MKTIYEIEKELLQLDCEQPIISKQDREMVKQIVIDLTGADNEKDALRNLITVYFLNVDEDTPTWQIVNELKKFL